MLPDDQLAGWVRKRVPSRERAEDLRRISLILDEEGYPDDAAAVEAVAELLLDLRQAARGGRRNVHGSRHWNDVNIHGQD